MRNVKYTFLLLLIGTLFFACSPTKHISRNGYILSKNKIECNSKLVSSSDLKNLIKQDPNGTFLGVKWGMYFYSLSERGEDSTVNFISRNVFRRLGSQPVELNERLIGETEEEMRKFLKSKGVFQAGVTHTLAPVRRMWVPWTSYKRREKVVYNIDVPARYKINEIALSVNDSVLKQKIEKVYPGTVITPGSYYDEDKLGQIRSTITSNLRESGYYAFNEKYIRFEVDTNLNTNSLNLTLVVSNPENKGKHKPYKIRNIYVYPDYSSASSSERPQITDTNEVMHKPHKTAKLSRFEFIRTGHQSIKDKPIMRSILFQNGDMFSPTMARNTRNALSQLQNFKYIDISFFPQSNNAADTLPLDCLIRLSMSQPIKLTTSFEMNFSATNNSINLQQSSSLGSEINIGFSHSNLLKGAEILSANIKTAAEVRSDIFSSSKGENLWNWFNAFELGFDVGIELPRFLAPFSTRLYSMRFRPHTSIKLAYNTQRRTYYNRKISTINYEYSWQSSPANSFSFSPVEVNYVDMEITDDSYAALIAKLDKRIQYQMSDHLVMDTRFGFVHNGQATSKTKDFNYIRTNVEASGNLLYLISKLSKQSKNSQGQYEMFGIPYSQYLRGDLDFVHYHTLKKKTKFVSRFFAGIGWYYGNATSLPYEKSFFAGGANNIRAWQLRELGPGSSASTNEYDKTQTGDLTFGINLEYRFPLFSVFEGAAFLDAGNIWTWKGEEIVRGSEFDIKRFYKEIAVGVGLGLRINIQFLILRFDLAAKMYDPARPEKDRFVIQDTKFKDLQLQIGIGYPF